MGDPRADLPNQAAPVSLQQLREALAFISEQYKSAEDGGKNVFVWLWESIQGDFNQERTTGQIVFDTAISMIPGVDQVCDVRDIIANCKQINDDKSNSWAWIALVLTLIGLIPTLGSLLKGVLKIFFLFIRRFGLNHLVRAVDEAMSWVITLLRRREVAKYWKAMRWDRVFHELANQTRVVRGLVTKAQLLKAFDRAVLLMRKLLGKVADIPLVGRRAQETIDLVVGIRKIADNYIGQVLAPVQHILDAIIKRLEFEDLVQRRGIVNAGNFHFTGTLPEAHAVSLMRRVDPSPVVAWQGEADEESAVGSLRLSCTCRRDGGQGLPEIDQWPDRKLRQRHARRYHQGTSKALSRGLTGELQRRCGLGYRRSLQYDHEVSRPEGHLAKESGRLA